MPAASAKSFSRSPSSRKMNSCLPHLFISAPCLLSPERGWGLATSSGQGLAHHFPLLSSSLPSAQPHICSDPNQWLQFLPNLGLCLGPTISMQSLPNDTGVKSAPPDVEEFPVFRTAGIRVLRGGHSVRTTTAPRNSLLGTEKRPVPRKVVGFGALSGTTSYSFNHAPS
uniref:Uncharacterized protein n=1 Tax=Micrurus carvalhoi TaxID=3147026 RepID=A0A2H6N8T1_9SAUR